MSVLQVVMAHKAAQETFDRHCATWVKLGHEMLIYCPENASVRTALPKLNFGRASHHDAHAIERFYALLTALEETRHDQFILQEYDSFSLEAPTIEPDTLHGNLFMTRDHRWIGNMFIHPPLAFDRVTLEKMVSAGGMIPFHAERGFWDRWLGVVCMMFRIQVSGWGTKGFSQNTIHETQIVDAVEARRGGAIHFHGVKDKAVFDAIMRA